MSEEPVGRRREVLESALVTFARGGYRSTSMDDVAQQARISRPGLYLYFSSKQELLRSAVEHALARDLDRIEVVLADGRTPLRDRLLQAFDLWSGQYVGPLAADLDGLLERDAALLGDMPRRYSRRFGAALAGALQRSRDDGAAGVLQTARSAESVGELLLALNVGLKHRAGTPAEFHDRFEEALLLLLA
jgi:AcrR family transcriptional regulator